MAKFVPISGASPADLTIEAPQIGGDPIVNYSERSADVELSRNGVPISVRRWTGKRRWTFSYNAVAGSYISSLREYFQARVFTYQPTGSSSIEFNVRWVGSDFLPAQTAPGYWSLTFTIEEVVS